MTKFWKKYVLWFAQEHVDFRVAEFESIVKLFGLEFRHFSDNRLKPFWLVEFPNDETALQYASRSVALRSIIELQAHANTLPEFHQRLKTLVDTDRGALSQYFNAQSFKVTVETYNKHFTQREK